MEPRILVFAGSTRADSLNRKLARLAASALEQTGAQVTLAELRDYPMPLYDGDMETTQGLPENAKKFKELVRANDALLIASPEYNGSFPALIKNTIDWISRAEAGERSLAVVRGKTAAIVGTSPGPGGGQRGLTRLRELLEGLGMTVIPTQTAVPRGDLANPEVAVGLRQVAEDLVKATRERLQRAA